MIKFTVYTADISYKPEYRPAKKEIGVSETPVYVRRVLAGSRLEALNKCMPDLRKELPKLNCRYLSVFVGATHNPSESASRMHPFQIDSVTGELRK